MRPTLIHLVAFVHWPTLIKWFLVEGLVMMQIHIPVSSFIPISILTFVAAVFILDFLFSLILGNSRGEGKSRQSSAVSGYCAVYTDGPLSLPMIGVK